MIILFDLIGGGVCIQKCLDFDKIVVWVFLKVFIEIFLLLVFCFLGYFGFLIYQLFQVVFGVYVYGEIDFYLWMSIKNIKVYVQVICDFFIKVDFYEVQIYCENVKRYLIRLEEILYYVDCKIVSILRGWCQFIISYDVYGYFVQVYGMYIVGFVIVNFGVELFMVQ